MTVHRIPLLARVLVRELARRPWPVARGAALKVLEPYTDPTRAEEALRYALIRAQLVEVRSDDGRSRIAVPSVHALPTEVESAA